jgi:hypothetical protein
MSDEHYERRRKDKEKEKEKRARQGCSCSRQGLDANGQMDCMLQQHEAAETLGKGHGATVLTLKRLRSCQSTDGR